MRYFSFWLFLVSMSFFFGFFSKEFYHRFIPDKKYFKAIAVMHPTKGNSASGIITFEHKDYGLHISAKIKGLKEGLHGFHIHTYGDCGCDDAVCAGDHFNPTNKLHGAPDTDQRHVGDFGNILADNTGISVYEFVDKFATLNGLDSIIGRSVIIHAGQDDLISQPSGNAGARVACGVIGIAK